MVRRHTTQVSHGRRGPFSRAHVLELDGIGLRSADHYTRLMPMSEAISGAFRLAMLPVRLIALGVLWATTTPTRLIVTAAICTAIAISL
ncbi:MAG: hypothetical protein LC808_17650 [Actinobacteria bacterium]|nr:hypothetical protein [Actinomycetota bacterium]